MKLWEEILVLRTRFEERSKSCETMGLAPSDNDELIAAVWEQALIELDGLIKRQTRTDTKSPYVGS